MYSGGYYCWVGRGELTMDTMLEQIEVVDLVKHWKC